MKYFVIAGTHDQYVDWKKRNFPELLINHQVKGISDIIYVAGADTLKGTSNPKGIFIGTWYTRSNITEIMLQLRISITDMESQSSIERASEVWHAYMSSPI